MGYITDINQRRIFAVDQEIGLVMAYSMFNHDGEPNPPKSKGVPGVTESSNNAFLEEIEFSLQDRSIRKVTCRI